MGLITKSMVYNGSDFIKIGIFATAYFMAHLIAFFFPDAEKILMIVWPAAGIGFAGFLMTGYRLWPLLSIGFFIAGIFADVGIAHRPLLASIGFMIGNLAESIGCALLVIKLCGKSVSFNRVNEVIALILGTVFINAATSCIGAGTVVLVKGGSFGPAWFSWYIADGLGILIVTPIIITWFTKRTAPRPSRVFETTLFILFWCIASWYSLSSSVSAIPHPYMLIAFLAWPAFRLGQRFVSLALFLLAAIAILIVVTLSGIAPLGGEHIHDRLISMQIFLAFTAATGFLLAASYAEVRSFERASHADREKFFKALERLDLATSAGHLGIWDWDIQKNQLIWDDRMYELYGMKRDDFAGAYEAWIAGIHPEERAAADELSKQVVRGEKEYDTEFRVVWADGSIHHLKAYGLVERNAAGNPLRMTGINFDITGRKLAEAERETALKELQETKERMQFSLAASQTGAWDLDLIDHTAFRTFEHDKIFGYKDLLPNWTYEMFLEHVIAQDRAEVNEKFQKAMREKGNWNFECRIMRCDGVQRWILACGQHRKDADGSYRRMAGIVQDITERKHAEEEHKKLQFQLGQMQKLESLGILAGGIAHDFNNLMGGIYGYIDIAFEESKDKNITQYLTKAMSTIDRARGLTQQLLTFAKGGAPIQKTQKLFPFVMETAQFALCGSNVTCKFDIRENLWACSFDRNQIGQVVDNLIINAQQAMPQGGTILISAKNTIISKYEHARLESGNYVEISVQDFGIGIPKEIVSRIFDPFFTTKAKGHGLGLATCYSIVNRHGGCIEVSSKVGKGSTFTVFLPASADGISPVVESTMQQFTGSGTFIVMDDEGVMSDTIGTMLASFGYTVKCVENGTEAIDFFTEEFAAHRTPAGMLFDLTIPGGMGGREAVLEIRKLCKETPVFVASGYADDPVMANPQQYGFNDSIKKPFMKKDLTEMLAKHLKEANG